MAIAVKKEDYEFLLLSNKFCNNIEKYADELGLDLNDVMAFQYDNELLQYFFNISDNYTSCGESFTRFKLGNMRIALSHLTKACKNSRNYNLSIGSDLGIEIVTYAFHAN